jgi:phosphomannomutase/phosphoglucomutase
VINPLIFREYDIRGRVDVDLTPETVLSIGKGFGTYAARNGVVSLMLGQDCRLSSPSFRDAMAEGLLSTGVDVVDVGICPTPLLYFSIIRFGGGGGVMITGSHNPPEFNGFKMCVGSSTLYGGKIQEIRRIIEEGDFATGKGRESRREVATDYSEYVRANISIPRRLKVVVDAGNGTAGPVAPALFRAMGLTVVDLFCEMDGRFPNHFPDPTVP